MLKSILLFKKTANFTGQIAGKIINSWNAKFQDTFQTRK